MAAPIYGSGGVRVEVETPPGAHAAALRMFGDRVIVLDTEARIELARLLLPTGYAVANEIDLL